MAQRTVGLSHMAAGSQKETIVPAGTFNFSRDRGAIWVGSQDIESKPAQDGEVFRGIVLSSAVGVLGEMDVEHPMELVLDTPMTASDMQQLLGRDVFGQEVVAHDRSIG